MRERFIEQLRNKPPHIRERILWATIIPIWSVVFVFWVGALFAGNEQASSELPAVLSPASALVSAVGTVGGDFQSLVTGGLAAIRGQSGLMATSSDGLLGPAPTAIGAEELGAFEDAFSVSTTSEAEVVSARDHSFDSDSNTYGQ